MSTTYNITGGTDTYNLSVTTQAHNVSLSRTGGQGAKGDSVSGSSINNDGELLLTISDGAGNFKETINAGSVNSGFQLSDLNDMQLTNETTGQILRFNGTNFVNHTLTTTNVSDIDNTGKTDGALLIYDGSSSKYKATVDIDNANTFLKGGTY